MNFITHLSDKKLYELCRQYGEKTRFWRQKFTGLLPEVHKRKLYLQYKTHSIHEFAAKLAGLNRETVNEVLRIYRLLIDAPVLQEKLISGEIPYTKLRPVAPMATKENQKVWLRKVETMTRPTLEVYVREIKRQEKASNGGLKIPEEMQQSGQWPEHSAGVFSDGHGLPWKEKEDDHEILSLKVNQKTAAKMRVFKTKLEKRFRKPLNWDETLQEILKLAEGKTKQAEKAVSRVKKIIQNDLEQTKFSKRYIPAAIRNQVLEKKHGICDAPGCSKVGAIFHHVERFALKPEHNPGKIKFLCQAHERIAHHSLIQNEENAPETWRFLMEIDSLVQKFRKTLAGIPAAGWYGARE